jgi:RNA polymerase-binding transcription factor DksA
MTADPATSLRRAREETAARVATLTRDIGGIVEASAEVATDDEHDPDGSGGIAFERAQLQTLLAQARSRLADLDAALERVEAGSYGVCEGCGEPIAPARLEARPAARTCISCASR